MSENITTPDVVDYIVGGATEGDLAVIINAINLRRKALRAISAAAVTVGAKVTLDGLSPKYLNGLTGTVKSVQGARCTVTLDVASTDRLSWNSRYTVTVQALKNTDGTYDFAGIPSSCAKVN